MYCACFRIVLVPRLTDDQRKGNEVTSNTIWMCFTCDSSYYFNPYMLPYREEGNVKFPFFLPTDRHYVSKA